MKLKKFSSTAPKFSVLQNLAVTVQTGTQSEILAAVAEFKANPAFSGKGWQAAFTKLESVFNGGNPAFTIFAKGNSKLPFIAFSTLPGVTCPGAGDCVDFCYSFRAWRYPSAFARQCQNAFLMRFNQPAISAALASIKGNFEMRLYVDGDFSSIGDVTYWMNELRVNPNVNAYGYSKSFALLLEFNAANTWPKNYTLNVSSGHNSGREVVEAVKAMTITRGEFIAVNIGFKPVHGSKVTNDAIRAKFDQKIFPCPGQCGSCTGAGHACGMPAMKGRIIAIALH